MAGNQRKRATPAKKAKAKAPGRKRVAKKAAPTRTVKPRAAKPASRKSSLAGVARELAGAAVKGGITGVAAGVASAIADLAGSGGKKRARSNGGTLPQPSTAPWGAAGKALDGVRILDFTHVQSGPTCT